MSVKEKILSSRHRAWWRWLRARDFTERRAEPTTVRDVEDLIPVIDHLGNRRTLIRIRTLTGIVGPAGLAEIERDRRHTLPGFGHVYSASDNEYVVFSGRMTLRLDSDAPIATQQLANPKAPNAPDCDRERVALPPAPALTSRVRGLRQPFPRQAVLLVLLLTLAGWAMLQPQLARPPLPPQAGAIDSTSSVAIASESDLSVPSMPSLRMAQTLASPAGTGFADDGNTHAPKSATLAFAVSPWGIIYVNGKRKGVSPPLTELKLAPGRYRVEIRNDTFRLYRNSIDLRRVTKAKIAYDFKKAAKEATRKAAPSLASTTRPYTRFLSEEWPQ
jgi:hypothetical protein